MKKWKWRGTLWRILCMPVLFASLVMGDIGLAAGAEKIIFIAHDNRPISMQQTAEVAEQAGCDIWMPPEELLSRGLEEPGNPEELWNWLESHAGSARAAVISTDSMLYGGLIPSRRHEISERTLHARLARFKKLRYDHPELRVYLFGSLMRTPKSGMYSGNEEPAYYNDYGADIFLYTSLEDKAELGKLSEEEKKEMKKARQRIPSDVMEDWMRRRAKNLAATKQLMDMARDGIANCFVVGRDDNAPFCRTHKENRELLSYAARKRIPDSLFRSMAGIDEFNLLLLTRAVNDLRNEIPFVHVVYNEGKGADTIPAYSDERIGNSIGESIALAGGMMVSVPEKADFVLLVNTDPKGRTGEAGVVSDEAALSNDGKARKDTSHFFTAVKECIDKGYSVGIADIVFSNGADNALMKRLCQEGLLEKLSSYSGWNTATNSSGFALGMGMLSRDMSKAGRSRLLARRYLDDWAYQSNVRTEMMNQLWAEGRWAEYSCLKDSRSEMEERTSLLLQDFARKNLYSFEGAQEVRVQFPWNRMFECKLSF